MRKIPSRQFLIFTFDLYGDVWYFSTIFIDEETIKIFLDLHSNFVTSLDLFNSLWNLSKNSTFLPNVIHVFPEAASPSIFIILLLPDCQPLDLRISIRLWFSRNEFTSFKFFVIPTRTSQFGWRRFQLCHDFSKDYRKSFSERCKFSFKIFHLFSLLFL